MSLGDVTKLSKDSFSEGELLELSLRERMPGDMLWKEEPEKIGVVDADRMYGHVILPPNAFAPICPQPKLPTVPGAALNSNSKLDNRKFSA